MKPIVIEGMYENGKLELAGQPRGVKRAKVIVTFFPEVEESEAQDTKQEPDLMTTNETAPASPGTVSPYPPSLREEYKALIQKKLHRSLTAQEAVRLEAVREEMNQRDRQAASWTAWESRSQAVEQQLVSLRQTLEALPDA